MVKKGLLVILVFCIGLVLAGCPKKQQLTGAPSAQSAAELAAEKEKAAKLEAARKQEEARTAKIREEEAQRKAAEEAQKKAAEEARKRAEAEAKKAAESLVAQKTPGIEGTPYVSGLLKDIYFDFDRYDVRPGDAEILKQNATAITKNPAWKIQIEGHCDERGTAEYNLALGERRASSVKKYLVTLGIPQGRISTISYGEERPFDQGHTEEAWTKNRRAHFIILSK
jgi:peptidoglycan-associated lipoprotein